jgi:XTP/dITP diphosphohydrolase
MARSLLIASNNAHKLQEFREIFRLAGAENIALLTPQAVAPNLDPEETGTTYVENARLKAQAFHRAVQERGFWVMADDSGLEVDALHGAPGLHSARYHQAAADKDGCTALLNAMKDVPADQRAARFRAVLVLLAPDGSEHVFEGVCEGSIGYDKRGGGGFGFDPVFRLRGETRHFAELNSEEKHRVSHRGVAARKMLAFLQGT